MNIFTGTTSGILIILITFIFLPKVLYAGENDGSIKQLTSAVEEIERLNSMRSNLAVSFEKEDIPADKETFRRVCKPVGMEMKRVAKENGWKIVQMAEKYRNPAHKLDEEAKDVYNRMEKDGSLIGTWINTEMDGKDGIRYFRRITVESSCLACHGKKESRPEFIKEGYPEDRAYSFEAGDLRGVYSVFIPLRN